MYFLRYVYIYDIINVGDYMKVGIIVYSQSGNTLGVAEKILLELRRRKIDVELEKIEVEDTSTPRKNPFVISKKPDASKYDVLVFGSLVEGFSVSPVMKEYLSGIDSLEGKDVYCFVTHFFPFAFLGGNSAISQMKKEIVCKSGSVVHTGIVNWKNKKREEEISNVVQNFCELIANL